MKSEIERRQSNTERVADFLRAHVGRWIDASEFEALGGRQAWRTRISDCRTKLGMHIENRVRYIGEHAADCPALQAWDIEGACMCNRPLIVVSEYRYHEHRPIGPSADQYREARLF